MSFSLRKGFTPKLHAVERLPGGFDVSVEYSIPSAYSTWFQFEFFFFFLSERVSGILATLSPRTKVKRCLGRNFIKPAFVWHGGYSRYDSNHGGFNANGSFSGNCGL